MTIHNVPAIPDSRAANVPHALSRALCVCATGSRHRSEHRSVSDVRLVGLFAGRSSRLRPFAARTACAESVQEITLQH